MFPIFLTVCIKQQTAHTHWKRWQNVPKCLMCNAFVVASPCSNFISNKRVLHRAWNDGKQIFIESLSNVGLLWSHSILTCSVIGQHMHF